MVLACALAPRLLGLGELVVPGLLVALVAGMSAAIGIALHVRARYERGAVVLVAGAAAMTLVLALAVLPVVERWKPVPPLVAAIRAHGAGGAPLATFEFEEPSLTFASGAESITHFSRADHVAAWAGRGGDGVLVTTRDGLARLGTLPLTEIAASSGWNVAKGRRVELVALRRR
jgi:hypothetical protein